MKQEDTIENTVKNKGVHPRLIYIGPNLSKGILQKYTVFKGGLPSHLDEVIEHYPLIKYLFVNICELGEKEKAVNTKGSVENTAYNEILKGVQ